MSIIRTISLLFFTLSFASIAAAQPAEAPGASADEAAVEGGTNTVAMKMAAANAAVDTSELKALFETTKAKADAVPEADKLRTPDSPAFVLLGVAPSEVQKPTTPRELAVALSALISDDAELRVPENLSIEVAPALLWNGPQLTYEDAVAGGAGQLWHNLSVSLASTEAADDGSRRLGMGFRTTIAAGGKAGCGDATAAIDNKLTRLAEATKIGNAEIKRLRELHTRQVRVGTEAVDIIDTNAFDTDAKPIKEQQLRSSAIETVAEDVKEACADVATARSSSLSFAGALAWRFPSERLQDKDLVLQSYWLTYSYTHRAATLLLVGRAQFEEALVGWDGFSDFGARGIVARESYAASLEVVARKQFHGEAMERPLLIRAAAQAEYMIKDGTWLTITFGKEFEASEAGSLFSIANLTTSFGAPKIVPAH